MQIDIHFDITAEKVRVWSDIAQFEDTVHNTILINTAKSKIYAIGRTEEEIIADSPDVWKEISSELTFFPAFNAKDFNLLRSFAVLKYYSFAIHNEIRSLATGMLLGRYDKFQFDILFEGYEQLSEENRKLLVREIFGTRIGYNAKVSKLTINAVDIDKPKFGWKHWFT